MLTHEIHIDEVETERFVTPQAGFLINLKPGP